MKKISRIFQSNLKTSDGLLAIVSVVKSEHQINFPPFRFDRLSERIYRGDETIVLRPKVFAVLTYLLERRERLVTKDELLDACWPQVEVSDTVLKVCIREIREALGDDTNSPRFIETIHRRGYRFIGQITTASSDEPRRIPVDLR